MSMGQGIGSVAGFIIGSIWGMGPIGMAIGGYIGLLLDPPGPPGPPPLGDLGLNTYVRDLPIPVVIGENRVYGGVIWLGDNSVQMENEGSKKSPQWGAIYYADFAIAFSEGELEASAYLIFYINDNSVNDAEEEDKIELTRYEYLGTSIQTPNSIIDQFLIDEGSAIPATSFKNTAYCVFSGGIGTGNNIPTISVDMRGLLTLLGEKDANPVKTIYEWITNLRWGMKFPTTLMDGSPTTSGSWKTESDFCDELVTVNLDSVDIQEPRFRYSKTFNEKARGFDIIEDILYTCRGFIYLDNGLLKIQIEKPDEEVAIYFGENVEDTYTVLEGSTNEKIYADFSNVPLNFWKGDILKYSETKLIIINQTATYVDCVSVNVNESLPTAPSTGITLTLRKDNIKEKTFNYYRKKTREISNRIRVEFVNRDDDYRWDEVEDDNDYNIAYTNEIREQTIRMEGIKRKTQAARMSCFLKDYHEFTNYFCNFQTDILGYMLGYGKIVGVSHTIPGWNAKLFRIAGMEEVEFNQYEMKLSLIEYVPEILHDKCKPIISTIDSKIPNPYTKPQQTERVELKEDTELPNIYFIFKRPDNDPYWAGTAIYKQNSEGIWEYLTRASVASPSVKLNAGIDASETTIYYDPTTMYSSFPASGTFWLEAEEVYYDSIDDLNDCFISCIRAYNDTENVVHLADKYCALKQLTTEYDAYTPEEIGTTLNYKFVSINAFGMYAEPDLAPTESITVNGSGYKPYSPGLFELNNQGSGRILNNPEDAILTWMAVTDGIYKGYGYSYGEGEYGGGELEGVIRFRLKIFKTSDNSLLRTINLDIDTETYTYLIADNESDNGGIFEPNLTFKVYQISNDYISSTPSIIITNT